MNHTLFTPPKGGRGSVFHLSFLTSHFSLSIFNFSPLIFHFSLFILLSACDSGDIEEQPFAVAGKGRVVKLTANLSGTDAWESKYSVSLAGFATGDNYAQVVRSLPATTPDGAHVELVLSNAGDNINTVELAITNRLRERIITLASLNLDDDAAVGDTIRMDLGFVDVSPFGALQAGLFDKACIQCHGGNGGAGAAGLNLTAGHAYGQLVNVPSTRREGMVRVAGGNVQGSLLHQILAEGGEDLLHVNHTEILSNQFRENLNEVKQLIDDWIEQL